MVCALDQGLRSSLRWAAVLVLLTQCSQVALGLRTASGSPCASLCSPSNDTAPSEIVCEDYQFRETAVGRKFQSCISCELNSTYVDSASDESDLEWALYNLRYGFSSCVYGYPEKVGNVSSPCPVACNDVITALEYDLTNPSGDNFDTWCGTTSFADNAITKCEACYNQTYGQSNSQVYLSNFLEALRYNCHFSTPTGEDFPITPTRIFSESMLPSSTVNLTSPTAKGGLGSAKLALIIALPILGFVVLLCVLAISCFFFIRARRKKIRKMRQPGHLHAGWNHPGSGAPQWATEYPAQAQGMYGPAVYYPEPMNGVVFVDADGRPQEVGYAKSPEEKASQTHPTDDVPPPAEQQHPNNGKMKQVD
ncbi:hypothetical protein P175DRAFT_0505792 [Aspergillus ochraceoroseus IBT 24754]|uniref:WSC domain-containing protein n=1 Tax=Aspergillus ochraceoroseus IBT 24754 TaxID=1392256 RepID=A0A2T5M6D3_9EURO|nr:uncharacterized protein P175DRAFT_0505792 [Aspergillus ochraceoroseus IBT 24754]PTU24066.1 hypothetical protein P175DRAFT_0505792 [Aspergillus ochraceoroseus IBT 24754]